MVAASTIYLPRTINVINYANYANWSTNRIVVLRYFINRRKNFARNQCMSKVRRPLCQESRLIEKISALRLIKGMGMMTSEKVEMNDEGRICSPLNYKIPNVRSIPRVLNVTLLKNHDYQTVVYSSKGVGEPPLLLSVSVLMALKEAVKAAREQIGLQGYFKLDAPATVQKIAIACGNQLGHLVKK